MKTHTLLRVVPGALLALGMFSWMFGVNRASGLPPLGGQEVRPFDLALQGAERSIASGQAERARELLDRALERDAKSPDLWDAWARWAKLAEDPDEEVYARHRQLELLRAQGAKAATLEPLWAQLGSIDPLAPALASERGEFVEDLQKLAVAYEKQGRRHSAIAVHQEILALDAELPSSHAAIERLAAAPDPSLAEFATPVDLFADVSEAFIEEFDAEHATWKGRAKLERENYTTHTDAGYRVLLLAAEAMEQMNAFYREFFAYGTETDGKSVPSIQLRVFQNREEYLELGSGPPVEWSGGQFTGAAVETYISGGDPAQMYGVLFHEAAHQFVSLATNAAGWLNEGLASFFEGCRILPNGTVLMNEPADHRLAPLATRMGRGWMDSFEDGIDADEPGTTPQKAPTFRILVENEYAWGPPWYAPTWGIVYFLYNYQDPFDGRFVYRAGFREFVDSSGGRVGDGAVRNFEEVVLANPLSELPPLEDYERPVELGKVSLPETVEQLDQVWKDWILALSRERRGIDEVERSHLRWARFAVGAKLWTVAKEHFEKALLAVPFSSPESVEIRTGFAKLLHEELGASDRAARLLREALAILESEASPDRDAIKQTERLLAKADPSAESLALVRGRMLAKLLEFVELYKQAERPKMVMHLAWRFGSELGEPRFFQQYADAARKSGKSLLFWELAYNEFDLKGWSQVGTEPNFAANGVYIDGTLGEYRPGDFSYRFLTLEELATGAYSLEAELVLERGEVTFGGLVFGRKGATDFHAALFFPGKAGAPGGTLDLASFYGDGSTKTWKHVPVPNVEASSPTASARSHRLRVDVTDDLCDIWFDDVWQGTQAFGSADVLRGSLGLLVGTGSARFKNVRFRASHPRDPSARIERDVRITQAQSAGAGANGSFLGRIPPFPDVERWVQEPRSGWDDKGFVPQLVVFWSRGQNDVLPLDGWLREFAERYESAGVEVISVCSPNDSAEVEAYLETHAFPGSVAVDRRESEGIGESFTTFGIGTFFLPRVLLLDVDHTVMWEGEPGFEAANPWTSGMRSFVADPLDDVIERRKLTGLRTWLSGWEAQGGRTALAQGRVGEVLALLDQASEFDRFLSTEVSWATQQRTALQAALEDLVGSFERISEAGAEAAIPILDQWAELVAVEVPAGQARQLKKLRAARGIKQWQTVMKACKRALGKGDDPIEAKHVEAAIGTAEKLGGRLLTQLANDLRAAGGDPVRLRELLESADQRPLVWLTNDFFGWANP